MTLALSSILHYWAARYGPLALVGGMPTHVRSSSAKWIDRQGILQDAVVNTPRFEWATVAGERRPVMRLEAARTNICLQSENFGTTWVAVGTPTRVAAAHTLSGVTLDLLGDDDGAGAEGYKQTISFTGNSGKNVSLFVKQDTSAKAFIELIDQTVPSTPFNADIGWNADGTPAISAVSGGTYWGYIALADGVFRLIFTITATITAAHTNDFYFFPASAGGSGGPTGKMFVGGIQIENATDIPGPYVKTTTASATQAVESFSWAFAAPPQAMMIYSRIVEGGTYLAPILFNRIWQIGKSDNTSPQLTLFKNTVRYGVQHNNGSAAVTTTDSIFADHTLRDVIEHVTILYSDGSVELIESINGAAAVSSGRTAANAYAAAWSDILFWPNGTPSNLASNPSYNQFGEIKIVKYADVVASTAQGRMDELRAFELTAAGEIAA